MSPCDRCGRMVRGKLFAVYYFCERCYLHAQKSIGLKAATRGLERLGRLHALLKETERRLEECQEGGSAATQQWEPKPGTLARVFWDEERKQGV